ncbi:MAG: hypothetical protein JWO59_2914, partial [Chloroflexi bacterium]|nr:hypothetical protein [Chloroflexota bacterium]
AVGDAEQRVPRLKEPPDQPAQC